VNPLVQRRCIRAFACRAFPACFQHCWTPSSPGSDLIQEFAGCHSFHTMMWCSHQFGFQVVVSGGQIVADGDVEIAGGKNPAAVRGAWPRARHCLWARCFPLSRFASGVLSFPYL